MEISREELLMKLGAARDQSRIAWRLAVIEVAADSATFSYRLDRHKLRAGRGDPAGNPSSSPRRGLTELDRPLDWTEQHKLLAS